MHSWARVAEISRTKTLDGGLVARGACGLPFLLVEGIEVVFVPPRIDAPRRAKLLTKEHLKGTSFLVHFDSVQDINTAEALVGSFCLVKRSDLPQDFDKELKTPFKGVKVIDTTWGQLGIVEEYIDHGAQALFKVKGNYGEILIPDVDEFIKEVNFDEEYITTKVPQGILELATKGDQALRDSHAH